MGTNTSKYLKKKKISNEQRKRNKKILEKLYKLKGFDELNTKRKNNRV